MDETVVDDAFAARVVRAAADAHIPAGCAEVVVAYEVESGPRWWLGVRGGRPVSGTGAADGADVTLRFGREVAAELVGGTLDVQRAVADGRVAVTGDVTRLLAAREGLRALATSTARAVGSTT